MRLAIVGATGMVGKEMLKILEERKFNFSELILVASAKSSGKRCFFKGEECRIVSLDELIYKSPELALFSAGQEISRIWAPKLAEIGCKVIDNSSYWRMSSKHKLVVPEINGEVIKKDDRIIANPNCSTIQLVMALAPLHKKYKIKRVVVSTYQSVSGTGKKGVKQLKDEEAGITGEKAYPYQIYNNTLPHCDLFTENRYTKEEMKLINETKKILDDNIELTATSVRVPVFTGHSESVNVTFETEYDLNEVKKLLEGMKGVKVIDTPKKNKYPMPSSAKDKDDVFVGRIRRDFSFEKSLNMWVVSDNLRKGAATNTIQIAEYLINNNLL